MVINIAFYETVFFILSLFRTRDFTPASCKSYLTPCNQCPTPRKQRPTPRNQCPTPRNQCPTPCNQCPTPCNQCPTPRKQCPTPRKQQPTPRILEKLGSATLSLYRKSILSYVHRLPCHATMYGISLIEIVGWYLNDSKAST